LPYPGRKERESGPTLVDCSCRQQYRACGEKWISRPRNRNFEQ
jgi:hypothetical protein